MRLGQVTGHLELTLEWEAPQNRGLGDDEGDALENYQVPLLSSYASQLPLAGESDRLGPCGRAV